MNHFNDISDYYVGELARTEERTWAEVKSYKKNAAEILKVIEERDVKRIIEVGCGSGFIPGELPDQVRYLGVDKNLEFLALAREKNPTRTFINLDIRRLTPIWLKQNSYKPFDLSVCFAVLKHFGLHEVDDRLRGILALSPMALFDIQITDRDLDNGTDFHHTFVTQEHVERVIREAGHKYLYDVVTFDGPFPQGHMTTKIIVTKRE